ncbi:unnamed protein product [Amoebophrya sp. A120]|nr:unnamed protein product [Amoebophrya sp. A120]|eukprot:GSA120T00016278001.1
MNPCCALDRACDNGIFHVTRSFLHLNGSCSRSCLFRQKILKKLSRLIARELFSTSVHTAESSYQHYGDRALAHRSSGPGAAIAGTSTNEAFRMRKSISQSAKTIQNRIQYFKREEDKIWKGLEEVRRQAAKIEDGRGRMLEKKLADKTLTQRRAQDYYERKMQVTSMRANLEHGKANTRAELNSLRASQGRMRKQEAQDAYRQKQAADQARKLANAERVLAQQREQLEAKLRINQERADRISRVKQDQEAARRKQETECEMMHAQIPQLEEEEMRCLQRLQNSRIVTQSVLSELEGSLGARNPVTNLLRAKALRTQSVLDESQFDLNAVAEEEEHEHHIEQSEAVPQEQEVEGQHYHIDSDQLPAAAIPGAAAAAMPHQFRPDPR